jgi:hypothetical protein
VHIRVELGRGGGGDGLGDPLALGDRRLVGAEALDANVAAVECPERVVRAEPERLRDLIRRSVRTEERVDGLDRLSEIDGADGRGH